MAEEFFSTGNLRETANNNFYTAHKCNVFCLELKMADIELGESEEDEAWEQQHYINCIYFKIQHSFITFSFIEGTYQRLILVLVFDTPDIFFEAFFVLDFLGVSADIYF